MENKELKKRLSNVRNLPTLPMVANNVIKLTQNPESTAFEIAEAIAQDQTLATKVLRTANSAYYGFPKKITTIHYAIVVLGLNNIKNIVLSTSIMERFPSTDGTPLFDRTDFWKHSLLCGIICKKISEHLGLKNTEEMFMCGLLHDFGKLIMDSLFHEEFAQALILAQKENTTLIEAESKIMNFTHSGVGALVLKKWGFPPSLIKAVEFHHIPNESLNAVRIASIVHVADYLCRRIGIGSGGDKVMPILDKKAFKLTNLSSDKIKRMSKQITTEFKTATGFLYEEK